MGMSFAPGGNAARSAISNGGLAGTRDGAPSQTGTIMIAGLKNMNRTLIRFLKFSLNSLQGLARGLWTGYRIYPLFLLAELLALTLHNSRVSFASHDASKPVRG